MATAGLTTVRSEYSSSETTARLEAAIAAAGMSVFARIDHGASATAVHMELRPTQLLIFGSAKAGTPLMQVSQAIGIDLPLKALVYQDASGSVWVAYNDPSWVVERHGIGPAVAPTVAAMSGAIKKVVAQATGSQ